MRFARGSLLPAALAVAVLIGADQVASTPIPASGSPGPSARPAGSAEVVLRMEIGGGLVGSEVLLDPVPPFTLYGDGTVVYRAQDGSEDQELHTTRLPDDAAAELLRWALDEGGLRAARSSVRPPAAADAVSLVFTVDADGVRKRVTVPADPPSASPASAEPLIDLAQVLGAFELHLPDDAVTAPYRPPSYRAVLNPHDAGGAAARPWPWPDLTPADLRVAPGSPAVRVIDLRPDQVAALAAGVPDGELSGIPIEAPDGRTFLVSVRPLLPDEIAPAPGG